jgi:hypothetical protein
MSNAPDDDDRRRATREAVKDADAANGEPDATDDGDEQDGEGGAVDDSPGAGIQRDVEPAEPNEPA